MRYIFYITGTRADYGLMRKTLLEIKNTPGLSIKIITTGMHLMREFGYTINEIKKDNFADVVPIPATYKQDNRRSMSEFIGKFILLLTKYFERNKPDIVILLGDRAEMLGGAIAAAYCGEIAIAHIHGGEITSTIDESARHAITKLSHIHFCATKKSAERVLKMGEQKDNIYVVGAPGLDDILTQKYTPTNILWQKYKFNPHKPLAILIQHPVTSEIKYARQQILTSLKALDKFKIQILIIYPNADPGGRQMIQAIKQFIPKTHTNMRAYPSIPREDYLGFMHSASFMIGNSSSGIIEAPSFGLPVINVGTRQNCRERGDNVIDTDYSLKNITNAIKRALSDKKFLKKVSLKKNPYGDGKASSRIVQILKEIKITDKLLQKKLNYQ